jgi:hypothetical protein
MSWELAFFAVPLVAVIWHVVSDRGTIESECALCAARIKHTHRR